MNQIRILITDNSMEFAVLFKERLEFYPGIKVVGIAHSGLHALHLLSTVTVDVLLLDIVMPGMDGLELLQKVRASDDTPLVFIVSALGTDVIVRQALRMGASGFFVKPVDCDKLVTAIGAAVHMRTVP
jgi:two-component system chemotaxis response regulator CheY